MKTTVVAAPAPVLSFIALECFRAECCALGWDWLAEMCTQALQGSRAHAAEVSRIHAEWTAV